MDSDAKSATKVAAPSRWTFAFHVDSSVCMIVYTIEYSCRTSPADSCEGENSSSGERISLLQLKIMKYYLYGAGVNYGVETLLKAVRERIFGYNARNYQQ